MVEVLKPVAAFMTLALLLVDKSFGDDKISEIIDYKMLIRTYTGYDYSGVKLEHAQIDAESVEKLRLDIIRDLVCSYTYSGSHYVRMSGRLLENVHGSEKQPANDKERFVFTDEASSMLATLYNSDQIESVQPLWWIFMYTNYFRLIVTGQMEYRPSAVSFTRDAVEENLANFLNQTKCSPKNLFNDRYDRSDDYCDDFERGNCLAATDDGMDFSIQHVTDQLAYNDEFVSAVNRRKYFTLDHLGLVPAVVDRGVLEILICDFAELTECQSTLNRMLQDYDSSKRTDRIEQRMAGIARLQSKLMSLLKIVMLQIARKHIIYIDELLPPEGTRPFYTCLRCVFVTTNRLNEFMSAQLTAFAEFISLTDDHFFGNLITQCFRKRDFRRGYNYEDFVNTISMKLEVLSAELYNCQLSFPKVLDKDYAYVKTSISRIQKIARVGNVEVDHTIQTESLPIKDSLISATVFIKYITRYLDIDFKVVSSFIRFEQNLQDYMNTSKADANTSPTEIHTAKTVSSVETK